QVPFAIHAAGVDNDDVVGMARVFENRRGIPQVLGALHHEFRRQENIHAIDGRNHSAPQIGVKLEGGLQSVEKGVGGLDLQQERHGAGERIEVGQQDFLGAQSLPLEGEI